MHTRHPNEPAAKGNASIANEVPRICSDRLSPPSPDRIRPSAIMYIVSPKSCNTTQRPAMPFRRSNRMIHLLFLSCQLTVDPDLMSVGGMVVVSSFLSFGFSTALISRKWYSTMRSMAKLPRNMARRYRSSSEIIFQADGLEMPLLKLGSRGNRYARGMSL